MTPLRFLERQTLEQRLMDAEATIEALLSGQIDAVIDSESRTPLLLASAQEALRLSEERYRRIVELANEGIWQIGPDHRTTFMNLRMARMLGCEEGMGLGRSPLDFLEGEEREKFENHVKLQIAENLDVRFTRLDGTSVWALLEASPIYDAQGRYEGRLAMVLDVSEHRKAAVALRASETQYREIVEATTDGVVKVDTLDRMVFVNRQFAEMLGYVPAEMIGRPLNDVLTPAAKTAAQATLERRRRGEADSVDTTLAHRNGTTVLAHVAGAPLFDLNGHYAGRVAVIRDTTERIKLQSELMASDRMATVGTLAAGVAHEINNPLSAVIGNLDYVIESLRMAGGDSANPTSWTEAWLRDEIREPLKDAHEAAQRVRFIVRDLKIFSRSPSDEPSTRVDVKAIMESSLRMAWNEIRHRAQLVKEYGPVPPITANEARLGQVFLNLIINAAQALEEGHAEQNEVRVRTRVECDRVVIEVSDTGMGIPPELIGRIFDAFYTTKAVGVGTGLGLTICHRLVTDMGGTLTVESEVGVGTTFRVSLPIAPAEVATVAPVLSPPPSGRRGNILVIDDEESVLRAVKRVLAKDHEVLAVLSGKEALAICEAERFDVILCDLMMPDMTGMDLHRELALTAPEQAERMVFLTGGAFTENARSYIAKSSREQIDKPFDAPHLREVVARYVRKAALQAS